MLADVPDETPVTRPTHFGDAITYQKSDVRLYKEERVIVDSSWQIAQEHHTDFPRVSLSFEIQPPDIGPEPD
jgi:hypothetical protein